MFKSKVVQLGIISLLLAVVGIVCFNVYKLVQERNKIEKEIMALKKKADQFSRENNELNKLVEYFDSQEFQEKEIKDKLNLVKSGERVVVIQDSKQNNFQEESSESNNEVVIKHANYYWWWKYFFGSNKE